MILEVPKGRIHYETHGDGPAVVFLHGLGGNHLSFWQQVPAFSKRWRVVTFAHRGFAPSAEEPDGPGPAAFVDDLDALVDHLGLPDVRLVAQSMGGWTAMRYTLRRPDHVKALVLVGSLGSLVHPDLDRVFSRAGGVESTLFARGIHPAAGERMFLEQPALHFLYTQIAAWAASGGLDRARLRARLEEITRTTPDDLSAIAAPVLLVAGDEDPMIPPESQTIAASFLRNVQVARIPRAGHSPYFERPDELNALVASFLSTLDP